MGQTSSPLELNVSRNFIAWLDQENISLGFTTYQTNRLFLLGLKPNGRLSAFERLFEHPMGLYITNNKLYMSSLYQIWEFDNFLPQGELYQDVYDRLFLPRIGYTTGAIDTHDLVVLNDQIIFINTAFSCLATLGKNSSFEVIWQPPFITKITPEDRCHLNGLAVKEDKPKYVTTVSKSDVSQGWRQRRDEGGCLIDLESNEFILTDLSMPHSPRWYQNKLWLLNSGKGDFGYVDMEKGKFEPVTFCPGYLRGLSFWKNYAIMGLSLPRDKTFSGLPLQDRLSEKDTEARCGLLIVDLKTGTIAHWLELQGVVKELYDVQVIPGVKCPMALGFKNNEIATMINFN